MKTTLLLRSLITYEDLFSSVIQTGQYRINLFPFASEPSRRVAAVSPGRSTFSIEMKFIHAELGHRRFTSSGPLPFLPHSADPSPPPPPLGQGRAPVYPRTSDAEERQRNLFAVNYVEGGFRSQRTGKWAAEYVTNLKDIFNAEWADVSWHKVSLPLRNWCPRCSFMWVMWISGHISVWHVPHICATMHFDKIFGWHYSVDPMMERSISTPVLTEGVTSFLDSDARPDASSLSTYVV